MQMHDDVGLFFLHCVIAVWGRAAVCRAERLTDWQDVWLSDRSGLQHLPAQVLMIITTYPRRDRFTMLFHLSLSSFKLNDVLLLMYIYTFCLKPWFSKAACYYNKTIKVGLSCKHLSNIFVHANRDATTHKTNEMNTHDLD